MDASADIVLLEDLMKNNISNFPIWYSCECSGDCVCKEYLKSSTGECLSCPQHLLFLVIKCNSSDNWFAFEDVLDVFDALFDNFKECQSICNNAYCLKHFCLFVKKIGKIHDPMNSGVVRLPATVRFLSSLSAIYYCFTEELKNCERRHFIPRDRSSGRFFYYQDSFDKLKSRDDFW